MKKIILIVCVCILTISGMAGSVCATESKLSDNINMAMKSIKLDDYAEINKKMILGVSVANNGNVIITSYDINYKIDDGTPVTVQFVDQSFNPNGVKTIAFLDSLKFETVGVYTIEVSITNINGQADATPSDNVMSKKIIVYKDSVKRKILMEQFSTESCSNCPAGTAQLKDVVADNIDVIWVTHHAGYFTDSFTIKADTDILPLYNKGGATFAPAVTLDRTGNPPVMNPGGVSISSVNQMLSIPAFISVKINGIYDYDTGELKVMVYGDVLEVPNDNLMLTVYLVEDAIDKSGQNGAPGTYTHNNVCRAVLTASWGDTMNFMKGTEYYKSFTTKIKPAWVVDNMRVVAFINNYDKADMTNCKVYNVEHNPIANLDNFVQKYEVTLEGNMILPVKEDVEYTLAGEGLYEVGKSVTITAAITSTNKKIEFVNWTLNGDIVSTTPSYTLTVKEGDGNMKYVANFKDMSMIGVTNVAEELSVKVYPNPANNVINVDGEYNTLSIIDITGKVLKTVSRQSVIDISDIDDGIYVLNIIGIDAIKIQKIVIRK